MTMEPASNWFIDLPLEKFAMLRADERFQSILKLCRIVNTLRFSQVAMTPSRRPNTPSARRQQFSSFFYSAAALYEGLRFTETLGKYFKDLPEFRSGFALLHADTDLMTFRHTVLEQARNRLVFHLDAEVVETSLAALNVVPITLASGIGETQGESYYDLADVVMMHYLIGRPDNDHELKAALTSVLNKAATIAKRFDEAAENLIARVLKDLGGVYREVPA